MSGGEFTRTEVNENKPREVDNYKRIKPENPMSIKELSSAVGDEFSKASKEAESPREYRDDNGAKYREDDRLVPNIEFERNGYKYKTDAEGRVISAEGELQVKNHDGRSEMDSRASVDKGDMRNTDDRGHLIADRFNGSGGIENLVPMDSELNQHGDYKKMENTLADAMKDGVKVELKVEPVYEGDSTRPSEFRVTYSMDGEKEVAVFKNESEARS